MRVEDARAAVRCLARKRQLGASAVEFRAPLDELGDVLRSLFHQHRHGFRAAQAVARVDGVLLVQPDFVFIGERHGNPALCPGGRRIAQIRFRQHQHASRFAEFNRGAQTCNSTAHDSVVSMMDFVGSGHGGKLRSNRPIMVARRKYLHKKAGLVGAWVWAWRSVCYIENCRA